MYPHASRRGLLRPFGFRVLWGGLCGELFAKALTEPARGATSDRAEEAFSKAEFLSDCSLSYITQSDGGSLNPNYWERFSQIHSVGCL